MLRSVNLNIKIIIVVILFVVSSTVIGQPKQIQFNQYTTNNGLSSSLIISMIQDHNGFMWIGTSDGLNRFDGHDFKIYKNDPSDPYSLADNLIISLFIDNNKNLYIGTNAGLSRYDPSYDRFINLNKDSNSCFNNISFQVRKIAGDNSGNLLLATNKGLICFNLEKNTYDLYSNDPIDPASISNSVVDDILVGYDKTIWVGTQNGLNIFNPETKSFTHINNGINNEDFSNTIFNRIAEDKNGTIWITSYAKGLFRIVKDTQKEIKLKQYLHDPEDINSISKNRLLSILVDDQNNLWIGSENDGIFIFNREDQNFQHYLSRDYDPSSMNTFSIECLTIDNSGNIWIGTFANGVNVIPKNSNTIYSYQKFKGGDLSILNNMVNTFAEDHEGKIWIGTDGGGINIFDKKTGLFKNLNTNNSKIPSDYITSILENENKGIWMTTWGEGIVYYNHLKNKFKTYNTRNSNIPDDNHFSICKGFDNDFWIGSFSKGLIHFIPEKNEFITYNIGNSEITSNYINVIRATEKDILYLGTQKGFFSFNTKTKKFKKHILSNEPSESLSNSHVYDILIDNDSCIWIGTLLGLNCFNPDTKKVIKYTTEDGLPGNTIRGILKDKSGVHWLSTTNGICRFDRKEKDHKILTKNDGLQSNEFRPKSVLLDSDDALYFGGTNGFNIIYPDKIKTNLKIPEIKITGMDLFNKPVIPNSPGSPLQKIIPDVNEITLNYDQSVITFYFNVMDFTRPEKNELAYMLENFDDEWIYCGNRRNVTYTNLDPGKYTFRVKGANNDGIWNNEGTSLKITVTPPWWGTWWFYSIVGICIVMVVFAIFYIRIYSLKKQKINLELQVKSRTAELAKINTAKDKLFSIIAHDLKNPFNVILGFSDLLVDDYKRFDEETLNKIFSSLKESGESTYTLLVNLLNWSGSQSGEINFSPVIFNSIEIINSLLDNVRFFANKKNIKIINKAKEKNLSVYADINMFSLICRNLLTNAIKFSNQGSEICIDVKNNEPVYTTFSISDQGIGIDSDKINSLFNLGENYTVKGTEGEKGTGLGLILCKEFVEKNGGSIWFESEVGKGSTFYFTILKNNLAN